MVLGNLPPCFIQNGYCFIQFWKMIYGIVDKQNTLIPRMSISPHVET